MQLSDDEWGVIKTALFACSVDFKDLFESYKRAGVRPAREEIKAFADLVAVLRKISDATDPATGYALTTSPVESAAR